MTLIDRALAAAGCHESHHEPAFDRANQCARNLHALLNPATQHDPNQAPSQVITERDSHRFEPGTARPDLLATYTENQVAYSFIPNHTDADFLLLDPMPRQLQRNRAARGHLRTLRSRALPQPRRPHRTTRTLHRRPRTPHRMPARITPTGPPPRVH